MNKILTNYEQAEAIFEDTHDAVEIHVNAALKSLAKIKEHAKDARWHTVSAGKSFAAAKEALGGVNNVSKKAWGMWMDSNKELANVPVNHVSELIRVADFSDPMINSIPDRLLSAKSITINTNILGAISQLKNENIYKEEV